MYPAIIITLLVATGLLEYIDAHGIHHPESREEDPSFDNLVEQKYDTLEDLDPSFVAEHRRKLDEFALLEKDRTHDDFDDTKTPVCEKKCHEQDGVFYSCDDLVFSSYKCSYLEKSVCTNKNKCAGCLCSCEKLCNNGKSCDEMIEEDKTKTLTCPMLQELYKCNCRGCSKCGDGCTRKCSMRDESIEGSHSCGDWYKLDPAYTVPYLQKHAVVSGTDKACACAGCSGNQALSNCPNNERTPKTKNYLDIDTAKAQGKIARMRLAINDDMVDPEKCKKNAFCAKHTCLEGDIGIKKIDNCLFERGTPSKSNRKSCFVTCKEEDILTKKKSVMVRNRFAWLKKFMGDLLSLKPTKDAIELKKDNIKFLEGLDPSSRKYNADLVVVVTMRPSSIASVAGYAITYQRDTERRATVGLFNWVPHTVDEELYTQEINQDKLENKEKGGLLYAMAADYRLMVHEVLHLTGAVKSDPYYFINKAGRMPCSHQIYVDEVEEWSGHRVRKIRTPKLLALARKQYGCSSLTGVPMEDHHIGYGSHWESRVFGSEIMSYGDNSGESYLSDLTLAYLEDTGYYVANYSNAGRLTPHTAETVHLANIPRLLEKDTEELKSKAGKARNASDELSPGYQRWGRHAGCDFVTGSPKKWPAEYRCASAKTGGCTPDHKMTARCTLETWGETAIAASTIRCEPPKNAKWGKTAEVSRERWTCLRNKAGGGAIPSEYRHLGPTTTLAGYNDAMDYVPHLVGYWNCQDVRPKRLTPLDVQSEAGSSQNVSKGWSDLFGTLASDASSIEGQVRCEECRCFKSSLVKFTDLQKFSPTFPVYGLCYVSNCYSEDYLQVGIKGTSGLYWYGCKPEGGKMYIPLFSGALHCPVAKEFCAAQKISGTIFTETNPHLEWILYAVICGIALIVVIVMCVFWKKIDHKVHFCCGIDQDQKDWEKIMESRHGKHSASGYCLTVIGAIWCIAGAALLIFGMYSFFLPFMEGVKPMWDTQTRQAPLMMVVGLFTMGVSVAGIEGAWKNHPTITLITYFYVCVCTLVICVVVPVVPVILSDPLELILESQWIKLKKNFPDSWQDMNSTEAIDHLVTVELPVNAFYFATAAGVFIVSVISGIVCSILQITMHVLVRNFEVVMNMVFLAIGIFLLSFSSRQFGFLHVYILVSAVVPACFLILAGTIGVLAACQKHETCFKIWAVVAAVGFVVTLGSASILVWVSTSPPPVQDVVSARAPSTCLIAGLTSVICEEPKPKCCSCVLDVDLVDLKVSGTTTGTAAARGDLAKKSYTGCEHSCYDVDGYTCTEVGIDITTTTTTRTATPSDKQPILTQLEPYIRSLPDKQISEITNAISDAEDIVDFDEEQLIAWMTAYIRLYAAALYTCCAIILTLFATNRLIIHWNHQNDFPHGDHPYYLMFAVSVKKNKMREKLHAMHAMRHMNWGGKKLRNSKTPLLKAITMAVHHTKNHLMPKKNVKPLLEVELFRDRHVGLGMSMTSTTYGHHDEYTCLAVNALRDRPDGSPGPAHEAGVLVGDLVLTANGYAVANFDDLKRALGNAKSATLELQRHANIVEEFEPADYDDHYPEIIQLHVRRASSKTKMGAKLAEVHGHGHSTYYDDEEESFVVAKEIWDGPLQDSGLIINDVLLTIDDHNVESLSHVGTLVQGKTEMDFVVKRMTESADKGHRGNKTQTYDIQLSAELGMGLNLKEIKSGLGESSSNTYLYVKELMEYPDYTPGPGLVAGVRQYDLVLKINDMNIHTISDARRAIEGQRIAKVEVRRMIRQFSAGHPSHPGQHVEATELTVVVTRSPGESLGLSLTESYGADSVDPFLVVTNVRPGLAGERAGIKLRDIIWRAEDEDVYSLDDLKESIKGLNKFRFIVRRQL